ncbi:MAG: 4Fe-4S binding protein [Clostridiales bacterium]|jgi:adenylylsulfate reductase subunit B|nr:4Fe-4S binding protein [Clostridiales bacterium]
MSIEITRGVCTGCGKCAAVCPGSLIKLAGDAAVIERPERCWGCASCVKECPAGAMALYLGEDIGGLGGRMTVKCEGGLLHWRITMPDGTPKTIAIDSRVSNRY